MNRKSSREELGYYLGLKYAVVTKEDPEGGFTAEIEELDGCMTQAETVQEAYDLIEDARKLWIEAAYEEGHDIPLPENLQKYTGKFLLRIPSSLHRVLVHQAQNEGVSLNQYVSTMLAAGVARDIFESDNDTKITLNSVGLVSEDTETYEDRK